MSVNLNLQSPVMSDIALNENLKLKNLMLLGWLFNCFNQYINQVFCGLEIIFTLQSPSAKEAFDDAEDNQSNDKDGPILGQWKMNVGQSKISITIMSLPNYVRFKI